MNESNPLKADAQLDLRGTPCPINFVRTKLQLKKMPTNSLLEVWLDAGEGYVVEQAIAQGEGEYFALWVRRPGEG
jgi:TusA-related sulfurtransferase